MTAIARAPIGARVLRTAARGAVLVGVGLAVGLLLLETIHNSGSPGFGPVPKVTAGGSTTSSTGGTTASTGKPPSQVKVAVLNGGPTSGAANTTANKLRGLGYAIVAIGNAPPATGIAVACKGGVSGQADTLAKNVGPTAQVVGTFPSPEPATDNNADCIVTLGK
jgi:hypothetical protein